MNRGIRISMGIMCVIAVGVLFSLPEIPSNEMLEKIGILLGDDSSFWLRSGQEGEKLSVELLGGYACFYGDEVESKELVWEENQRRKKENGEVEYSEAIVGDVVPVSSGKTVTTGNRINLPQKNALVEELKEKCDVNYLWQNFYIVDSTTSVTKSLFDVKKLLSMPMTMKKKSKKKQICIYHTHGASEYFADSRDKVLEDSVVGVGDELAKELEKRGYGVYHDRTQYDYVNGGIDRSLAYNKSLEGIKKIRERYPDIEVMIDLHRDSVGKGKHTYTTIQGKKTAIVMFFNGMSRTRKGEITYLNNPNLQGNLAFSLQLKCKAMECYEGLTKPIYLKGYRYNLHLEKKSLLLEWGNENNSVLEAKNAAAPMADILDKVLSGKNN